MKKILFLVITLIQFTSVAQQQSESQIFWNQLKAYCGQAFEGSVSEAPENDDFRGKKLLMHVRSCEENVIRIPFFVGEDRSRTWVLTFKDQRIELKHDHRLPDGSEDTITMYGGIASNTGLRNLQIFPADQYTAELLPPASTNIWWITLDDSNFSYNLKRIGSERIFSIKFDLNNPVETPDAPWAWNKGTKKR